MAVGSTAKPVLPVPLPRALTRERLTSLLPQVAGHRLTLIVGPAGSGKTTLLHQFASALDLPSAWFSAGESADMDHQSLLARLDMAFADLAPGQLEEGNGSGRQVPIHQGRGPACGLLVLDDWHVLVVSHDEETI